LTHLTLIAKITFNAIPMHKRAISVSPRFSEYCECACDKQRAARIAAHKKIKISRFVAIFCRHYPAGAAKNLAV